MDFPIVPPSSGLDNRQDNNDDNLHTKFAMNFQDGGGDNQFGIAHNPPSLIDVGPTHGSPQQSPPDSPASFKDNTHRMFDEITRDTGFGIATDDFEHIPNPKSMTKPYPGNDLVNTMNFMEAERGGGEAKPSAPIATAIPVTKFDDFDFGGAYDGPMKPLPASPPKVASAPAPPTQHYTEEIQSDYLNPYASTTAKSDEKFISSEDLIGDFKEPEKPATTDYSKQKLAESLNEAEFKEAQAPVHIDDDDFFKEVNVPKPATVKVEPPKPVVEVKPPQPIEVKPSAPAPVEPKKVSTPPTSQVQMISAEEMFCKIGLVESLIYWRDTKKSGIVFGAGLVILLAISCFSVISVIAYASLLSLAGTISFRIYKNVLQAVQKTSEGHPFKDYLDLELTLSQDKVQQVVSVTVAHLNAAIVELRHLFLVEDLIDSVKFGFLLWALTYIGSWFNGMTLVIFAFVALFTLPKVYENNKQSIDAHLQVVRTKILEITDKVKAAVPIGKKQETEKEK